ncbi:MAG: hypothetical protein AAB316_11185 [Bacteroidota bacterium]
MKFKHEAFYRKYAALRNPDEQQKLMKQYALSLPPNEALDFLLEGVRDFGKFIQENEWTAEERKNISQELGEYAAMLEKMKTRRLAEAA